MAYGAIDLHKKESQVRIVTEEGGVIDRRIATRRDAFTRCSAFMPAPAPFGRGVDGE